MARTKKELAADVRYLNKRLWSLRGQLYAANRERNRYERKVQELSAPQEEQGGAPEPETPHHGLCMKCGEPPRDSEEGTVEIVQGGWVHPFGCAAPEPEKCLTCEGEGKIWPDGVTNQPWPCPDCTKPAPSAPVGLTEEELSEIMCAAVLLEDSVQGEEGCSEMVTSERLVEIVSRHRSAPESGGGEG